MRQKYLSYNSVSFGCDPEFFFEDNGAIVGAEKVLTKGSIGNKRVIVDGVQAEMNPRPNTCRANLGVAIADCFRDMKTFLRGKQLNMNFKGTIEVKDEEFESLSEKSKEFGCAPDYNIYKHCKNEIKVNPVLYKKRTAGGHIHLGIAGYNAITTITTKNRHCISSKRFLRGATNPLNLHELDEKEYTLTNVPKALRDIDKLIPMLDIIIGNTCVLIDRGINSYARREIYGKAGDYRLTPYGVEYRTLSNFWLRAYPLMSFVMGLARTAVMIVGDDIVNLNDCRKEIMKAINLDNIKTAIDNNSFALARYNFLKIVPILVKYVDRLESFSINSHTLEKFKHFVNMGIDYWFKDNPIEHWSSITDGHHIGWESFCKGKIANDIYNNKVKNIDADFKALSH